MDWACSLRQIKKLFRRHELVHLMHPILIFTMGQVRQRNGVKPPETWVLDVKYVVRNQMDTVEHRNGVKLPKILVLDLKECIKILFIKLTNSTKHSLQHLFGFTPYTLRLKLVFRVVSRHFVATPNPLWKSVSGALNAWVYASETISCFVATNMPNPLFQSKTHVLHGPCHFVDTSDTLQKLVSRCI